MKKIHLFLFSLLFATGLYAQNTATLYLRGVVTENMIVTFNLPEVTIINLADTRSLLLGSITLGGNQIGGYSISIISQNGGQMRGAGDDNNELPYSLSFGDYDNIDLSTGTQLVFNSGNGKSQDFPIRVKFPRLEDMANPISPGIYEDIITITISAT